MSKRLIEPVPIGEKTWPEDIAPKVTILCSTYNHKPYIRECIEGFLMQETTFPVEIIIRDDCSTDGTTEIIREYEAKYPNLFSPIYEVENQYSKGILPATVIHKTAHGEYMAFCEGDDCWLRKDKLEEQVALLEANPDSFMCVAKTRMIFENSEQAAVVFEGLPQATFSFEDLFSRCYLHTSTYVMRSYREVIDKWSENIRISDTSLRCIYSDMGPVLFFPEIVSVYRVTGSGVWSRLNEMDKLCQEIKLHDQLYMYFYQEYRKRFLVRLLIMSWNRVSMYYKRKDILNFLLCLMIHIKYSFRRLKYCRLQ